MQNNSWKKIVKLFVNSVIMDTVNLSHQKKSKIDLSINELILSNYLEKIQDLVSFNKKLLELAKTKTLIMCLEELNNIISTKNIENLVEKIINIQRQLDATWLSLNEMDIN